MKIVFSKQELKRQKDLLKRFQRYLPTLTLKMQQLKIQLNQVESKIRQKEHERKMYIQDNEQWTAVFGEEVNIEQYVKIQQLQISSENLAGILIPSLVGVGFTPSSYDLFRTPMWLDYGVAYVKERINIDIEIAILHKQHELIDQELRITTQRVNLFEKIRIPQAKKNINRIIIHLGDQHTAAVVVGKIAKRKLVEGSSV